MSDAEQTPPNGGGKTPPNGAVKKPPKLDPDTIASTLGVEYPEIPDGYVPVKGYLSQEHGGLRRIFLGDTFRDWIEVDTDDIAAQIDIPSNETDPRSVLYLKRKAKVIACHARYAHEMEADGIDPGGRGLPGHPPWP